MHIKFTILGLLIYVSMFWYLMAFFLFIIKQKTTANVAGFIAWAAALVTVTYRWTLSGHLPMQNLFEVFICLGALIYPLSWFSWHKFKIPGRSIDMLFGFIVLFPAGFIFSATPRQLPPALQIWLFGPHVAVYMLSYVFMAKAFVQSCKLFFSPKYDAEISEPEIASYIMVCAGFPLLTAGLLLGSVWGQLAWGDWWSWDPKEMWSLASWLIYAGYFYWRAQYGSKFPKVNAFLIASGFSVVILTLLWVNLSNLFAGLHNYTN